MAAMVEQGVWDREPVHLPPGKTAVTGRLSLPKERRTRQADKVQGTVCSKGVREVPGVDYGETFAAVAKMPTVRLLSPVGEHNLEVHLADIVRAFLT